MLVNIGTGATGETTPTLLVLDSTPSTGSASDPSTEIDGAIYYNAAARSFRCDESGVWRDCLGGLLSISLAPSSEITATAHTDFSGGTNNSYTVLANDCQQGVTYLVTAVGTYTTTSTGSALTLYLDEDSTATTLMSSGAENLMSGTGSWKVTAQLVCTSTTSMEVQGIFTI